MDAIGVDLSKKDAEKFITQQLKLITIYMYLIDSFFAEFFVNNLWNNFPASWQKCLKELSIEEFSCLISFKENKRFSSVLPLSLQAFIVSCHHLALPRKQLSKLEETAKIPQGGHVEHNFRKHVKLKKQYEVKYLSELLKTVADELQCFKTVDVGGGLGHLSRYLALVHKFQVTIIESEGHHKIKAEQYDKETMEDIQRAKLKDNIFFEDSQKDIHPVHITKLVPLDTNPNELIDLVRTSRQEHDSAILAKQCSNAMDENICIVPQEVGGKVNECERNDSFILVGLHTCGDLSPTLLRTFVNCSEVRGIVLVGCCYMKLTCENLEKGCDSVETSCGSCGFDGAIPRESFPVEKNSPGRISTEQGMIDGELIETRCEIRNDVEIATQIHNDNLKTCGRCGALPMKECCTAYYGQPLKVCGFPMSSFLRIRDRPQIGWDAFELACHNLDNYILRLRDDKEKLKIQSYRAVLEVVIRRLRPDLKNPQIRCQRIKGSNKMEFRQYAEAALKRIHISKPTTNLYEELNVADMLARWKEAIIFYSLRLLLGPVIESLVLLDRYLYLTENGYSGLMCPVFDAKISPRSFALVALKSEG